MSLLEALKDKSRQLFCEALKADATVGGAIPFQDPVVNPKVAYSAGVAFCNDPEPLPPAPEPPFNGGQCPVRYNVSATINGTFIPTGAPISSPSTYPGALGPIGGISADSGDGTLCRVKVDTAEGTIFFNGIGNTNGCSVTGISVARQDGNPDNCGDPPPPEPPPFPPSGLPLPPQIVGYDDASGDPQTYEFEPTIKPPRVDIDGNIVVPIVIVGVDASFTANLNINTGDINIGFGDRQDEGGGGNGGGGGGCGGDPELTDDPPSSPVDGGNQPPREPDGDEVIIGVLVTVSSVSLTNRATEIAQGDNPSIFAPSLGFVNFLCRVGGSVSAGWTTDIPVKNRRQVIQCPWADGAIAVAGTPQPGVSWVLTPIKSKVKTINNLR